MPLLRPANPSPPPRTNALTVSPTLLAPAKDIGEDTVLSATGSPTDFLNALATSWLINAPCLPIALGNELTALLQRFVTNDKGARRFPCITVGKVSAKNFLGTSLDSKFWNLNALSTNLFSA